MRSLAIAIGAILAGLGIYNYISHAEELQQLELTTRCQQLGAQFVKDIRAADDQAKTPAENREFTYRSHYNKAEKKCFVLTEGEVGIALFDARALSTQIWDVDTGVGATAVAERDIPLSKGSDVITQRIQAEGVTFYQGEKKVPPTQETRQWFDNLMIR